jgi:hypothetical protein
MATGIFDLCFLINQPYLGLTREFSILILNGDIVAIRKVRLLGVGDWVKFEDL